MVECVRRIQRMKTYNVNTHCVVLGDVFIS